MKYIIKSRATQLFDGMKHLENGLQEEKHNYNNSNDKKTNGPINCLQLATD